MTFDDNPSAGRRRLVLGGLAAAAGTLGVQGARAQAGAGFPAKPIRIVVPYAAGGGADGNARLLAQAMTAGLGQTMAIENKPGASGIIAAQSVVQSPADGYTLLFDTFPYAVNAVLRKLPFDPVKDLLPVSQAINMPNLLVVPASAPYKTLKELVDHAKANPGKLNYASYGAGGTAHLAAELLRREAGIDWVHVPYKGGAPAITDLLAGQVSAYFANPVSGLSYVKAGRLRALATTGPQRMAALPEVPTFKESGYPNFEVLEWNGFFAPAGTPPAVIDRLSAAVRDATRTPEVQQRLAALGIEPVGSTPKEFATFLQGQISRWGALVKAANITVD
ncbi:tripartite tricarboxylate transporter substrate binding protein [Aquincola sp. J276]|uniref:Bug family tripartite tricarboxylate transporter substrate binding protein n=1 Tax=Aquincola sp. J276 TaxID=2898432 RepID=UPI002151CB8C|nr:tripartite tricarboxylate transporter substrate binding protein [Aquincola sp. J276]MCR5868114.1 tripartite tricarboxylate transporter substrate binding protein [Aquincola sp. J276]